jgi:hypothetical protein
VQIVERDPNNKERLCSRGFTEADWNAAYADWVAAAQYHSDSDSEFDVEEIQARYP